MRIWFIDFQRREIRRFFTGKLVRKAVIVTVVVTAIIVFEIVMMTLFDFNGSFVII